MKTKPEATDFEAIRAELQAIIKRMEEIRREIEAHNEVLKTEKQ